MSKPSFEEVWRRILDNEGETFHTKRELAFTYTIFNNQLTPSRTNYHLHKSNFKKAQELMPISRPGDITNDVRGPSYVWAILNDKRIASNHSKPK